MPQKLSDVATNNTKDIVLFSKYEENGFCVFFIMNLY